MSTSTSSTRPLNDEQIHKQFVRFRILVIGRANSGKTTILQKLCNSTRGPTIFNPDGHKVKSSTLDPSMERGEHNIQNQMVFGSNPGFVFHDSRGFEAGDAGEFDLVQEFIEERSKARNVNERLHVIWYCIPTSDDRPITAAEKRFFNESGAGIVPVILVWTKTDALDDDKIIQFLDEGMSMSEAKQRAPQEAWAEYEREIAHHFDRFQYPPKAYVVFRNMNKPGADCKDLIDKTTAALSSEELQRFFLSTQQNNVELCIKYGIKRILNSKESVLLKSFKQNHGNWAYFMALVLDYFPQFVQLRDDDLHRHFKKRDLVHNNLDPRHLLNNVDDIKDIMHNVVLFQNHMDSVSKTMSFITHGLSSKFSLKEATYCAIVAAIVGNLSFILYTESSDRINSLESAAQMYRKSRCDASVKQAVQIMFMSQSENSKISNPSRAFSNLLKRSQSVDNEKTKLLDEQAIQTVFNIVKAIFT